MNDYKEHKITKDITIYTNDNMKCITIKKKNKYKCSEYSEFYEYNQTKKLLSHLTGIKF